MGNQDATGVRSEIQLTGPNLAYVLEQYEHYRQNPDAVSAEYQALFAHWSPPTDNTLEHKSTADDQLKGQVTDTFVEEITKAQQLVQDIREYGHLAATMNPLRQEPGDMSVVHVSDEAVSEATLSQIPARWVWKNHPEEITTAAEAIVRLQQMYTGTLGFDFAHVHDVEEQKWLRSKVESGEVFRELNRDQQLVLLQQLIEVDEFERFLQRTFVGQKRFSIEGVDMLVPMLSGFISQAVDGGTTNVMIGMAHRGRLNTLAHILGKPYEAIFSEFHTSVNKDLVPSEGSMGINFGWSGDVKYHLGARRNVEEQGAKDVHLVLANNPSHLEFVDPVVEGFARAAQDNREQGGAPTQDVNKAIAILVHGDAAFPGEGIVAETLNLSGLEGYQTGGTIHIIANNQLGFTAEAEEGRSTRYASDLARGFEIPIVHVSADDPEACMRAVILATAYREKFHKDFLVDLIGYRRWGHNEMDDPAPTQPEMYKVIKDHPRVRQLYAESLKAAGVVTKEQEQDMEAKIQKRLHDAYNRLKESGWEEPSPETPTDGTDASEKTVASEALQAANHAILTGRDGFTIYSKLHRVLERRQTAFEEDKIDWAHAEELAFATILMDGIPIRMTGQDSERGTFSQRHLVMHDEQTGERDCPLQRLPQAKASFAIHNSPLSEAGVMGFEYGYDVQAPDALVIWEAQFGDFANAAQVIIDQFLASGLAKWRQPAGLVLLLPHGYEGQGPEHSSARLERYLQLSAQMNWRVTYPTTAAQYFHLLRSQAAQLGASSRPLVVMTPKSLLRNPRVVATKSDLTSGEFQTVLMRGDFTLQGAGAVRRLVLTAGKVAVDLETSLEKSAADDHSWLAFARIEQLYPFPNSRITELLNQFPGLEEVVWLQEEPANMGAWSYVQPLLQELLPEHVSLSYAGRRAHASPAEGSANVHQTRQDQIIHMAIDREAVKTTLRTGGNENG